MSGRIIAVAILSLMVLACGATLSRSGSQSGRSWRVGQRRSSFWSDLLIYLVGGAARAGKTTVAKRVLQERRVPYMSTDSLVDMLWRTEPSLGVANWGREKAHTFYPFLRNLLPSLEYICGSYLLEGNAFLPEHVAALAEKFRVLACFLGYSRANGDDLDADPNSWFRLHKDRGDQAELVESFVLESERLRRECEQLGIAYFDVAGSPFPQLNAALQFLQVLRGG